MPFFICKIPNTRKNTYTHKQTSTSKFWQHERSCSCCQQTGLKEATFTLDCPELDPPYKKVCTCIYHRVASCRESAKFEQQIFSLHSLVLFLSILSLSTTISLRFLSLPQVHTDLLNIKCLFCPPKVKTHAPVDCLCRACTDLAKEDLRPQELVEVLSGNSGETTQ